MNLCLFGMGVKQMLAKARSLASFGKRGQANLFSGAAAGVIGFVILVVTVAIAGILLAGVRDDQTASSIGWNISNNGLTGVSNISAQFGLMGTAFVLGLVLLVVVGTVGGIAYARNR